MKRMLLKSLAGIAGLFLLAIIAAWLLLRSSLPQLDGEVTVAGLDGPATIVRDGHGIPTITAGNRADLAFATGFAHGQDRFFQMDIQRRRAAGELAEILGARVVEIDKRFRFHRFRARARDVLARASDAERELMQRYAEGVNAGLRSLSALPFEYYLLRIEPRPWTPEDSVLVVYLMFTNLNDTRAHRDLQRGYAHRVLPNNVYRWLYPEGTDWDAPLMGDAREAVPYPPASEFSIRDRQVDPRPAREQGEPPFHGSNNWAVGGALTTNGRAIVANDMHLGLNVPNIYYQARLRQQGDAARDLTGVTLPGAPFIIAGSNGRVAWGYTNSYGDWSDAVVLQPGDAPDTYRTASGIREFETRVETILVKDAEPVEYGLRETIWGPVDDTASYPDGEIAVRWIAHEPEAVNLAILALERAASASEALDIAGTMGIPPQNFVTGDAGGNIGWTIAGRIPVRQGYDPLLPADWSSGAGWDGWRRPQEYPRILNPADARIWTANARVADGEALEIIGGSDYDLGARARQIRDALYRRDTFTPQDMLEIQYDDRAILLDRWRSLALEVLGDAAIAGDEALDEYRRLLDDPDLRAAPESVAYRLVRGFRIEVRARVFQALIGPVLDAYDEPVDTMISTQFEGPLWELVTRRPAHLLPANYDSWEALLVDAVREHIDWLQTNYDGPLRERTWGEYNTVDMRHVLSWSLPLLSGWLDMPRVPVNGDANLPKAQGRYFGASERFAVAPGDEQNGIMHMPGGQSGHPLSEFYKKGHEDWLHGRPSPFLPGEGQHTLTLTPERR